MRIYGLQAIQSNENAKVSVTVESERLGVKELWFSVPLKYKHCLCDSRMDGFLVAMLFPAMQYGEDIHIMGCISRKLLFNLNNYGVPLLLAFSPSCKKIKVTAEETSDIRFESNGVGAGFSGGVDSFCTIYDRFESESVIEYKINGLVFLNVGSHGGWGGDESFELARRKFLLRYDYLKKFPDEIGLEFIPLDSNLHVFHPWGHQKTHSLTSAAGTLILQNYFSKYYYASTGIDYQGLPSSAEHHKETDVGMYCEPILLPLLSTESLDLIPDGYSYTRSKKTLRILDYEPAHRYLNVCVSETEQFENCSVCPKCCRTLMTLSSAGREGDFKRVFDIEKYKKRAELPYVCKQVLMCNKDPFARDNVDFAKANGVKLPSLPFSFLIYTVSLLSNGVVQFARFLLPPSTIQSIKALISKLR